MSRLFTPPADAYSLTFEAKASEIDANGHVNNVVYLSWAQDLAIAHWEAWASAEQRAPWSWICRRHEVDYRRELLPNEIATGYTWVGELKGPRFERYVRIDGPDGEMCAQCRTDWVLIDVAAKRPARVMPWMVERFTPKGQVFSPSPARGGAGSMRIRSETEGAHTPFRPSGPPPPFHEGGEMGLAMTIR